MIRTVLVIGAVTVYCTWKCWQIHKQSVNS